MRNIAEIIEDDRNGKQLSQTERQIAVAYIQGKYDALMELKTCDNTNAVGVFDMVRAEINAMPTDYCGGYIGLDKKEVLQVIDKYKVEVKPQESEDKE